MKKKAKLEECKYESTNQCLYDDSYKHLLYTVSTPHIIFENASLAH